MVNGLHLYSAFFVTSGPKLFKKLSILPHNHPFIHTFTHTDGGVSHAGRQPARREQLGLGALLRDTSTLS